MNAATATAATQYADGKILKSVTDGVGVLTFNNPERRNAMSLEMWEATAQALTELRDDAAVRVVILHGAGGKAFVSGADISQFEKNRHNAEAAEDYNRRSGAPRAMLAAYPKPTIACIQGYCIGGGMALAMAADMRIASAGSKFGIPAAKLGIAYGYQGLNNLVALVGPSRARMLMFTGMQIDAAEALGIGLIDRMVHEDELWGTTFSLAATIAENAPLAVSAAKITIDEIMKDPAKRDMKAIDKIGDDCFNSADFKEGRTAFMAKRKPNFTGR